MIKKITTKLQAGKRTIQFEHCLKQALKGDTIAYVMIEGTIMLMDNDKFQEMADKAWKYDELCK